MSKISKGEQRYGSRNRNKLPAFAAAGVLVATVLAGSIGGRGSGDENPGSITDRPGVEREESVPTTVVIIESGDTAWEVAEREIAASGIRREDIDILPVVDDIVGRNGVNLQPGQTITFEDIPNQGPPLAP